MEMCELNQSTYVCINHTTITYHSLLPSNLCQQWLFDGTATGSILAYDLLNQQHEQASYLAKYCFRQKGGYNSHLQIAEGNQIIKTSSFVEFTIDLDEVEEYLGDPSKQLWNTGVEHDTIFHRLVLANDEEHLRKIITRHSNLNMQNVRG